MNKNLKVALGVAALVAAGVVTEKFANQKQCFRVTGVNAHKEYIQTDVCVGPKKKLMVPSVTIVTQEPIDSAKSGTFKTGEADGFECACSSGSGCEQLVEAAPAFNVKGGWREAPRGLTLAKGHWRGALCVPKSCVELASRKFSSWPKGCPQ